MSKIYVKDINAFVGKVERNQIVCYTQSGQNIRTNFRGLSLDEKKNIVQERQEGKTPVSLDGRTINN